jgi:hypothetical protein
MAGNKTLTGLIQPKTHLVSSKKEGAEASEEVEQIGGIEVGGI